jgi:cytochrome c-type biogenesis protein CcmH
MACWLLLVSAAAAEALPARTRAVEARFMSPCCWHENLTVHDSQVARQLRAEVAALIAKGDTEDQVVDLFVARYGERILAEPRGTAFRILTFTPVVLVFAALLLLVLRLRTLSLRAPTAAFAECPPLPEFDGE